MLGVGVAQRIISGAMARCHRSEGCYQFWFYVTACQEKGLMNIAGLCSIGFAVLFVRLIQIRLAMPSFEKISPACQCKSGALESNRRF
jgi:hypothetical protein